MPVRHFYGVQFLKNSVKWFVILYQLFQPAEETFFYYYVITWTKYVSKSNL